MIYLILAGQVADLASTIWGIRAGNQEANPVWYQDSLWVLIPVKLVAIALMIAIVLHFRRVSLYSAWVCALLCCVAGCYATGHNLGVIL